MALNPAQNVLGDSISALGFAICFYYGFTGLACIVYFRREITKSVAQLRPRRARAAARLRDARRTSSARRAHDYSQAGFNYSAPFLGIEMPIVIGIGALLLGFVAMLFAMIPYRDFFRRKPYTEVVAARAAGDCPSSTRPAHLHGKRW